MKKPFLHALAAALYITVIVLIIQMTASMSSSATIIIPITMISLFVLSTAVMGFLFLSEPLKLLIDNRKQEAVAFFVKVVGFFACFVVIFAIVLLLNLVPVSQ